MDSTDKIILEKLQASARMTNVELAKAVGLSPPAVLERVKKLEDSGVIRQYVALLDEAGVGKGTQAFVAVSLELHDPKSVHNFTRAVKKHPAILECYHLSGEEDYLLRVLARDIAEYESFLLDTLLRMPGLRKVRTQFVLSTIKKDTAIPLENLPLSGAAPAGGRENGAKANGAKAKNKKKKTGTGTTNRKR